MDGLKVALNIFFTQVTQSVGVYTAFTGMFLYHVVFEKDFECSCDDQTNVCILYMILPVLIILVLVLWLDGSFRVLLKYSCLKGTGRFGCFLLACFFRAVFIGLLWPISVMVDGDWFICCRVGMKLDCGKAILLDDKKKIKELKNESRIYGFGGLLGIILLVAAGLCFPWKGCCSCLKERCTCLKSCWTCLKERCTCLKSCWTCLKGCWNCLKGCWTHKSNASTTNSESESLSEDVLFKKIVLEEGENLVTNKMIEAVKDDIDERIKKHVSAGKWLKCYDVVNEIITESSTEDETTQRCDEAVTGNRGGECSDVKKKPTGQSQSDRSLPESSSKRKKTKKSKNYEAARKQGKGGGDEKEQKPLIDGSSSESPSNEAEDKV